MASFKQAKTALLDAKYERRIRVFLESAEDVRIFSDHWFSHKQDKLRFISAEGEQIGGGGCKVVINKVAEANQQAIKAYGIVDRDVLLGDAKLDLFWEADDDKFHTTKPYGDRIHVLRRWELENYLLQPEAFAEEAARRVARSPAPTVSAETFLELADDLVQLTALTTCLVANGKGQPNTGFGVQASDSSALVEEINRFLKNQFTGQTPPDFMNDVEKLRTFDCRNVTPEQRWERLSRILDGKKSLMRLCNKLGKRVGLESIKHWEEMRGCLANIIVSRQTIDPELLALIDGIALS